ATRKICSSALELSHGRIVSHSAISRAQAMRAQGRQEAPGSGLQSVSTAIADYALEGKVRSERSWEDAEAPKVPSGRLALAALRVESADGTPGRTFSVGDEV